MSDLSFQVRWKVDDVDGPKRTFLWTDTTTDTQTLRNVGNFGLGGDFDAKFARSDNWARLLALLTTFLQLSVHVHPCKCFQSYFWLAL
jgi:hypothetical protein